MTKSTPREFRFFPLCGEFRGFSPKLQAVLA